MFPGTVPGCPIGFELNCVFDAKNWPLGAAVFCRPPLELGMKGLFQFEESERPTVQQAIGAPAFPVWRLMGFPPRPKSSRPSCS